MPAAWSPTPAYLDRSRLRRFANANGIASYDALLGWATDDLERFWRATERDLGLEPISLSKYRVGMSLVGGTNRAPQPGSELFERWS